MAQPPKENIIAINSETYSNQRGLSVNRVDPLEELRNSKDKVIGLKYIFTERGYFFCDLNTQHDMLYKETKSYQIISAGFINLINRKTIQILSTPSSSLKVGPCAADYLYLRELFDGFEVVKG